MIVDLKTPKMYLPSPERKEYTPVDTFMFIALLIGICVFFATHMISGDNSTIPSKDSRISQGGKWTEGYERGRMTQLCTYEKN